MEAVGAGLVGVMILLAIGIVLLGQSKPPKKPSRKYRVEEYNE
jgi:hypothetical protein